MKIQSEDSSLEISEEEICFNGKLDITGDIKWEGIVRLQMEGNGLIFAIETDYASIEKASVEVRQILIKYPVIGNVG